MAATVIIIEDNTSSGKLAAKLLRTAGHTIHLCEDGESGYEAALEHSPNLVLVDLGLPDMDGQTVVALLRQEDHLTNVPMIAFTAYPPDTARDMAKAYGCDGVITKPIDTRTFAEQIEAYLNANSEAPSAAGG